MSPLDAPKRSTVQILLVIAIGLLCLWQFHIPQFASNFDTFPGDRGDARLITYLMEHWYRVFQGLESWRSPAMFHPVEGAIGYADLVLGYGIVYSALRTVGLGIFKAAEFTIIIFNFLNYLVCFVLLNKVLRFNLFASIAGAAFFAFNSPKLLQMNHAQLQPMVFLPLALIGFVLFVQKRNSASQKQAFGLIALAAISLALQLMTGFYAGWFFIFWSSLFVVLTLLFKSTRDLVFDLFRKFWRPLVAGVAVFTVALIPFVMTYLPIIRSAGGRSYADIQQLIPVPRSFLLMGERNYLWGELSSYLETRHPINLELRIGIGLIPTLAWVGLVVFAVWFLIRTRDHRRPANLLLLSQLIIATCLVYVLGTKYYDFSPWRLVYSFIPGAQAIRGVARYALVLALPMAIAFSFAIDYAIKQTASQTESRRRAILFTLFVVIGFGLAEQFASRYGFDGFSIKAENVYLNRATQSFPNDCSSFYVAVKPTALHHQFEYQLDAMFISLIKGVPTLNGYSGQWPPNWHLWDVKDPGYENNVKSWIDERQLKGNVCRVFINETTAPHDIADMDVFIRQEYLDLLGREPDRDGFLWWLNRCKAEGNCDRVSVSIGILDSNEFLDRSYFVLRLYLAVLGRLPSHVEFNRDRQAIVSASKEELDSRKDALIRELVQKSSVQEVRAVIDDGQTVNAFRSQAFVLMQFFAHLNRDPYPNEYKRRLKYLERTGDRRSLVNDFLYSPEYRKRFGYVN